MRNAKVRGSKTFAGVSAGTTPAYRRLWWRRAAAVRVAPKGWAPRDYGLNWYASLRSLVGKYTMNIVALYLTRWRRGATGQRPVSGMVAPELSLGRSWLHLARASTSGLLGIFCVEMGRIV